jgi:hypothetical protein
MSPECRGNPCHETAGAFEFKHSINSRKSLLKGIGVGSLPQFKEYGRSLLRGHLSARKCIGGIGFLERVENAYYFLHCLILRWLFGCSSRDFVLEARIDVESSDRPHADDLLVNHRPPKTVALAKALRGYLTWGCLQMIERNGGDDGARTRDLRRDRPAF